MRDEIDFESLEIATLLSLVEEKANRITGTREGHFTIMGFTTHYKAMFGTPNLDSGIGRREVCDLLPYNSLKMALAKLLT